jgi:hypothetical protein
LSQEIKEIETRMSPLLLFVCACVFTITSICIVKVHTSYQSRGLPSVRITPSHTVETLDGNRTMRIKLDNLEREDLIISSTELACRCLRVRSPEIVPVNQTREIVIQAVAGERMSGNTLMITFSGYRESVKIPVNFATNSRRGEK